MRPESIENSIAAPAEKAAILDAIRNGEADKVLSDLTQVKPELHPFIADALIENGQSMKVVRQMADFQGLDHSRIAKKIIETGSVLELAENLEKFTNLDSSIADSLIAGNYEMFLGSNLGSFKSLSLNVARKLLKIGEARQMAENLERFATLPADVIEEMIDDGVYVDVARKLTYLDALSEEVAEKLIAKGQGVAVAKNLERFQVTDYEKLIDLFIARNEGGLVAAHIEKFIGVDRKKIADMLIVDDCASAVAYNLEKFPGVDHSLLVEKLLAQRDGSVIVNNIEKFKGLDYVALADRLIEAGDGKDVAGNLGKFQGVDQEHILDKMLKWVPQFTGDDGRLYMVTDYVDSIGNFLHNFDHFTPAQIADKMLETGNGEALIRSLDKFKDLDHVALLPKLIKAGLQHEICANLQEFAGIDHSALAEQLIDSDYAHVILPYLSKFHGLNLAVATKFISFGERWGVANNISSFKKTDHYAIALKLIANKAGLEVVHNILKFECLTPAFADLLNQSEGEDYLDAAVSEALAADIDKFEGVDLPEMAQKMIDQGRGYSVAAHIEKFKGADHATVAESILQHGGQGPRGLCEHLQNFSGVDYAELAVELIDRGYGDAVAKNIGKFKNINYELTALDIIEKGQGDAVIHHLNNFPGVDQSEIINSAIAAGCAETVAQEIKSFATLEESVALNLIDAGYAEQVLLHPSLFVGLLTDNELAERIENRTDDSYSLIGKHLESFYGLKDHFAQKIIEKGMARKVSDHLLSFDDLGEETARLLVKGGESWTVDERADSFALPAELTELAGRMHLRLSEALIYNSAAPELKDSESIAEIFRRDIPEWQDFENIVGPFEEGAKIFGEPKMLQYLERANLSRHDGLHQFLMIISLYDYSGLSASEFYNNILQQVAQDDSEYYSGSAHHQLNAISLSLRSDFDYVKKLVLRYPNIEKLQELFSNFKSRSDIFSSWKNLKKFKEVQELLDQKDVLEQLSKLKEFPEKKKLREYVETLAFHPNISMQAVFSFWRTPAKFFELDDEHTDIAVHDQKKPSNYIEFPNLDLSAEELRDALIEGSYDTLQSFKPFTIEYDLGERSEASESVTILLKQALGKRSENIKGEAKNPPKLFKALQQLCKSKSLDLLAVLAGSAELSPDDEADISALVYAEDMGLARPKIKTEKYRAQINKKSDPNAVVAGNDTACCMPFGSGKNNVYTFNPNCSLFTVQRQNGEGVWRTIAQSVLTEDVAISRNISEIVEEVKKGEKHLNALVGDDILSAQPSMVACDNIEVAESYKDKNAEIKVIYQDFFREYLKRYAKQANFSDGKIVIGKGYTDALRDLPQEENKFIPRAPVGYSDKLGHEVFVLDLVGVLKEKVGVVAKNILENKEAVKENDVPPLPRGVEPLTFRDALPVAYIEGKAYAENESLIEYLHNMENALIAKDVNNSAKQRPNMSFKYTGDDNKMHGYILAYEGKMHKQGENVVYVSDLASDGNGRAGGSLILGFTESYKRHYIDTGNVIPIYAQMRENTSYPIIKKQLDKLAQGTGIRFQMQEVRTYHQKDDLMHEVLISPVAAK